MNGDDALPTPPPPAARARGTRPSAFHHFLHDRGVRLAAGLAVVVAIPVAVLFYFQFRALSDLEQTSEVVLRQLSQDTADSLTKTFEETLRRPHISVLLRIPQARSEPLDLPWIDPVLDEGLVESPFVEAFWVWSEIGENNAGTWYVYDHDSLREAPGALARRFRPDPELAGTLMPRLRELSAYRRAIVAFTATIDGRTKYIQVQMRFASAARDRMTSFIGFAVDAETLRASHMPQLARTRLAAVQGPRGFPPLSITLVDDGGALVYASDGARLDTFVDERSFPLVFFDKELLEFAAPLETHRETWRLRTGFGGQPIAEVVSASTRPQLALMVVLAVVMGGGVFFVAGAAAREVRVAELKSNFVAAVSHDLKTPLALIQLFAETLELGRVRNPERALEYYRIINGEARKLTRLIENILDFSKMEAGLRPYRMGPASVSDITTKVLSAMNSQFTQNQFKVAARIEPGLPLVLADSDAVEQALENLLANAMKYSGDARDIDVDVRRAGGHIAVSVSDHGIGIPRREQQRIFRKFYRVHSELGGGPQGCGLGLAIVDHTMRGHGGWVRVESEPDRGSTFTLCFPIPAEGLTDGAVDEADSGDRGRAADAAWPA
ncbi:MAG: HAMP domain-containing sensor histidine kinase [Vicinamibacterales bacterium]|nr:HAMP domain-containing sensor histidine kinase [Vicinamibacterales bacterium]